MEAYILNKQIDCIIRMFWSFGFWITHSHTLKVLSLLTISFMLEYYTVQPKGNITLARIIFSSKRIDSAE